MRGMMGGMGGMGGLMAQAQKMQAKLAKVQEELAKMEIEGEAGSGSVKVTMNGKHECLRVAIDPKAVDPEDVEMLEDLVQLAVNDCVKRIAATSEEMTRRAVPLPPGMKLPF